MYKNLSIVIKCNKRDRATLIQIHDRENPAEESINQWLVFYLTLTNFMNSHTKSHKQQPKLKCSFSLREHKLRRKNEKKNSDQFIFEIVHWRARARSLAPSRSTDRPIAIQQTCSNHTNTHKIHLNQKKLSHDKIFFAQKFAAIQFKQQQNNNNDSNNQKKTHTNNIQRPRVSRIK